MLIVLGRTKEEKGAQLERLTFDILEALGYQNLVRNEVGPGGEEIDVTGEISIPSPGGPRRRRMICECKAHRRPCDINDWLKFLGKVYAEAAIRKEEVYGSFIALNGVNGNVRGNYETLRLAHDQVEVLSREALMGHLSALHPHRSAEQIIEIVRRQTPNVHETIQLVYFGRAVYWVVTFGNGAYTVLSADGAPVTGTLPVLREMLQAELGVESFVDLGAEEKARERAVLSEKQILAALFRLGGGGSLDQITGEVPEYTREELQSAATRVRDRGWVTTDDHGTWRLDLPPHDQPEPRLVSMLQFAFTGTIPLRILAAPLLDDRINLALVDAITRVQAGCPLNHQQRETVLALIRLSPTALGAALTPQPMIVNHRLDQKLPAEVRERVDHEDPRLLIQALVDALILDYRHPKLGAYFFKDRGVVEVDVTQVVRVKSLEKLLFEGVSRSRMGHGEMAEQYGGGLRSMWILEGAPDPWERPSAKKAKVTDAVADGSA